MDELVVKLESGKKVNAILNGRTIYTDQPQPSGDGSAPTPFELFLASLGTCAGIFVKGFCQQRGIPEEDIHIIQKMEWDMQTRLVKTFILDIKVPEGFPMKYKNAVATVAEQCLVKRHFEHTPKFVTNVSLADQA